MLGLGDSVVNGGVLTDNQDLATTLASDSIIQILNISAGSWGPDNCAAYLKEYGTFGAKMILLVVSSHDAHDIMDFTPVVDIHKSYPSRQYKLAIFEAFDRYIIPRYFSNKGKEDPDDKVAHGVGIQKGEGLFNPGFNELKQIADHMGIPIKIYLHPDIKEVEEGYFNVHGREIIQWAKENNVPLTKGLDEGETAEDFRDGIHLNVDGQKILAKWMKAQTDSLRITHL